jgi:outer membrane protein OmpA-like peptidoglycan-associated protein
MKHFLLIGFTFFIGVIHAQTPNKLTVYFQYNKYNLTAAATATLDSLLVQMPIGIALSGYCDSIGSNKYNDALSNKRIAAIRQYLLQNKVDSTSVVSQNGYGKRQPINTNRTEIERYLNRRVDITYSIKVPAVAHIDTQVVSQQINASLEKTITDTALKLGQNIVLPNFNFVGGRHVLLQQSIPYQAELLAVLKKYPSIAIEIQGHVCCVFNQQDGYDFETATYNLSVNRAKAIYEYLVKNGIDSKRLSYKGFGSTQPKVYPEKDENDASSNRRVEIKIISK